MCHGLHAPRARQPCGPSDVCPRSSTSRPREARPVYAGEERSMAKQPKSDSPADADHRHRAHGAAAHPVGVGASAAGAGVAGAALGAVVAGPVGAVVGAAVGAVAGGLGGKAAAEVADPEVEETPIPGALPSRSSES